MRIAFVCSYDAMSYLSLARRAGTSEVQARVDGA